jgi:hypothetical protein
MTKLITFLDLETQETAPVPAGYADYSQFDEDALLANRYEGPEGW